MGIKRIGSNFESGDFISFNYITTEGTPGATIDTTSYSQYENITEGDGVSIPSTGKITPYAKISARAESPGTGETTDITLEVEDTNTRSKIVLTNLSVSFDGGFETKESAWQEITSLSTGTYMANQFVAKVSGGSASASSAESPIAIIGYRVD